MDRIEKKFLEKIMVLAEDKYEDSLRIINCHIEELEVKLGGELTKEINKLEKMYKLISKKPPRHIVISYLRSSLLDRFPMYQISMYDESFIYSEQECAVMWDISELTDPLYKTMNLIQNEFQQQTRAELYYIDEILLLYGDRYNGWFMEHIPQIIRKHLMNDNWSDFYSENHMKISAGEYRNQLRRIFEWRE